MSQSSFYLDKILAKFRGNFRSCRKSILSIPKKLWTFLCVFSKSLWRGELDEKEKIVLRKNVWSALWRCWPHLVTLFATAPLAYLNIAGYFVGATLQGHPSRNYQAFYQLCLQVTAKILELLVVASLGIISIDILSSELLSGSNGLPLGLLSSKQRFTEVQYLFSPEFRFGLAGYPWRGRWRTRLAFALFIITSLLLSLFVGPSVALLVIPTARTDWSGGGASLWLWGDNDSLWPSSLTNAHIGPSYCVSPDANALVSEGYGTQDCLWNGFPPLLEFFRQAHLVFPTSFNYDDGIISHDLAISLNAPPVPSSVYTIHLATGVILANAAQLWYNALTVIPKSSRYHTLLYRDREATTGYAQSWLPAVRTSCNIIEPFFYNQSNSSGLQMVDGAKYPFLTNNDASNDLDVLLPTNFSYSAQIETQWIEMPQIALLNNGSVTDYLPSAFMNIALPNQTNSSMGTVLTCSVDARWVMGRYKGGPIAPGSFSHSSTRYVQAVDLQGTDPFGNMSRPIQMDIDWLSNLTPATSNDTTSTTLAAILTAMDLNSLGNLTNSTALVSQVVPALAETVVAAVVADGMSRVGYTALIQAGPQDFYLPVEPSRSIWPRFMAGKYKFPRPSSPGPFTELDWTVEVSGLAYRVDSNAYKLALAVLFTHAALALAHFAYVVCNHVFGHTRDSFLGSVCDTWDSFLGFVVLAARSGAGSNASVANSAGGRRDTATLFKNAGAGIERYRTMETEVRIRSKQTHGTNNPVVQAGATGASGQQVEILFGRDENTLARAGFRTLEVGKAYG